jgi:hypothetical protein
MEIMETIAVTNQINTSNNNTTNNNINNTSNPPTNCINATDTHPLHQEYLSQLTPLQRKAHAIAVEHLATSFDITRSNGYNEWIAHHPSK